MSVSNEVVERAREDKVQRSVERMAHAAVTWFAREPDKSLHEHIAHAMRVLLGDVLCIVSATPDDVVARVEAALAQVPKNAEFQCVGAEFAEARGWSRLVSQLGEMQRSWNERITASDLRALLDATRGAK